MITLGSQSLGVGLAITLRDQFTQKARNIQSQFQKMHGDWKKVMEENLRASRRWGLGMIGAGLGITKGFSKALHISADFQHVMKTLELVTSATKEQMQQFDAVATKLGTNTIFSPQDIGSGMEYLAKAGFNATDILGGTIQAVTYLGAALDKQVGGKGGVADQMTHIMQGFNVKPQGAMMVADMITKTALASSSDLEDIHEALKYVSATAVDLKISLPEILAMIAKLSNAGLRGGIGGRSLNNMLLQIANSMGSLRTKKQKDILKLMGIDRGELVDSTGRLRDITTVIKVLDRHLAKMPDIERVSALSGLLNIRGARAVGPLLRDTGIGGSFTDILEGLQRAEGESQRIAIKRMDTMWGSFERMKDTIWNFFKTVGKVIEPIVKPLFDWTIKLVSKFTEFAQSPLGKPFVILAAVGGVALMVMGTLLVAFTSIKLISLASTVTFANMGRSLALAWNQGNAAALRYMTTAKGAMLTGGPAGKIHWRDIVTGRFAKGSKVATIAPGGGIFASFIRGISSASAYLGRFGNLLKGVTGMVGLAVAILGVVFGFKNIIKLVIFGLHTLLNALLFVGKMIFNIMSNPLNPGKWVTGLRDEKERFKRSQDAAIQSLGMRKLDQSPLQGNKPVMKNEVLGIKEYLSANPVKQTKVEVNLDGKKVGEIAWEEQKKTLEAALGADMQ